MAGALFCYCMRGRKNEQRVQKHGSLQFVTTRALLIPEKGEGGAGGSRRVGDALVYHLINCVHAIRLVRVRGDGRTSFDMHACAVTPYFALPCMHTYMCMQVLVQFSNRKL